MARLSRLHWLAGFALSAALVFAPTTYAQPVFENIPKHNYGPDRNTPMGRKALEILSRIPDQSAISQALQVLGPDYRRGDKIRWMDGPLPYRGFFEPNTVQALFVGQEGTHFAVWMKLPGGSGFGGRAHDFVIPFGIHETVATTNHSFTTITGQYGFFEYPVVKTNKKGQRSYTTTRYVPKGLHMLMNKGSVNAVRNEWLSWIIENNKESLKMVLLLGNAGADTGANFLRAAGAEIPTFVSEEQARAMELPLTKVASAGGNNEHALPIDKYGRDIAQELLRKYGKNKKLKLDYSKSADKKKAAAILRERFDEAYSMMVFEGGGEFGNGAFDLEQFGSNLSYMKVNGKRTQRTKGLKFKSVLNGKFYDAPDILWLKATHPSALSRGTAEDAAKAVQRTIYGPILKAMADGWELPTPEPGLEAPFRLDPENFRYDSYSKIDLPYAHRYVGTPNVRMGVSAKASRAGRDTVMGNTRERGVISRTRIKAMDQEKASRPYPDNKRKLTYRNPDRFDVYDDQLRDDKVMEDLLFFKNQRALKRAQNLKRGKTWKLHGKAAYYVSQHKSVGPHGHYRGDLKNYDAIVLFDPSGADAVGTGLAATGDRGQRIQGLMKDMGIAVNHLVLQTAPFMMDDATDSDWKKVLRDLKPYFNDIFEELLVNRGLPKIFITDGPQAKKVMERVLAEMGIEGVPVINIERDPSGRDMNHGLPEAAVQIAKLKDFKGTQFSLERIDIPEEHKTFVNRHYDGTAGDRVITSKTTDWDGYAFAMNMPEYASDAPAEMTQEERSALEAQLARYQAEGMMMPGEKPKDFVKRRLKEGVATVGADILEQEANCSVLLKKAG